MTDNDCQKLKGVTSKTHHAVSVTRCPAWFIRSISWVLFLGSILLGLYVSFRPIVTLTIQPVYNEDFSKYFSFSTPDDAPTIATLSIWENSIKVNGCPTEISEAEPAMAESVRTQQTAMRVGHVILVGSWLSFLLVNQKQVFQVACLLWNLTLPTKVILSLSGICLAIVGLILPPPNSSSICFHITEAIVKEAAPIPPSIWTIIGGLILGVGAIVVAFIGRYASRESAG